MKNTTTLLRSVITLDTIVDFVRDWFKSIMDDITNLLFGMLLTVAGMMSIMYIIGYQDEIIYFLVSRALASDPAMTVNFVLASIGAALYLVVAITVSILFSIAGFQSQRDDALDRVDELLARIDESGLDEETARELIALLDHVRANRGK